MGNLERLKISKDGRHLETVSGKTFLWMADTTVLYRKTHAIETCEFHFPWMSHPQTFHTN